MYLTFYGLTRKPFQDSTHPDFFWLGETHRKALEILKDQIHNPPGLYQLTGDIGTGKTTLINVLISGLGDEVVVGRVTDPGLELVDFLNCISEAFNVQKKFVSQDDFFLHFGQFLHNSAAAGKKVLLVIDECQRLRPDLLVQIRKLANADQLETKALNILLIGQNELNDIWQNDEEGAMQQRIPISCALPPLDLQETGEFIHHRLKTAGAKENIFTPDAIREVHEFSAGIPRKINIICDHALLSGFTQETKTLTGETIRACAKYFNPPDSAPKLIPEPQQRVVCSNSNTVAEIIPEGIKKNNALQVWTTVGTFTLIIIGVFILTYLIYPREYESLYYRGKNIGTQVFDLLGRTTSAKFEIDSEVNSDTVANPEIEKNRETVIQEKNPVELLKDPGTSIQTGTGVSAEPPHEQEIGAEIKPSSPKIPLPPSPPAQQNIQSEGLISKAPLPSETTSLLQPASNSGLVENPEIIDLDREKEDIPQERNDFKDFSKLKEQMIQKIRNDQSIKSTE